MIARRLSLLFAAIAALRVLAGEPGFDRGFAADKVFDFQSGIDTVNTFNGNVSLQLPVGPAYPVDGKLSYALTLVYNAKVWDYETNLAQPRAVPSRRSNAGPGWLLSLGRLVDPSDGSNDTGDWIYESPDGAEHVFSQTLHHGIAPDAPAAGILRVAYTRDGSYLRLLVRDSNFDSVADAMEVESPDGTVRSFSPTTGRLHIIRDRFGNWVSISYPATVTGTPCPATANAFAWVITDSANARVNYVCFQDQNAYDSDYEGQIERVVLAAPPDPATGAPRTTTYLFTYTAMDIRRGCHSPYPDTNPYVEDVPMLTSVRSNPDLAGEELKWSFGYNTANTNAACETGTLRTYTVPTGATIDYTYRYWPIPVESCGGSGAWWSKSYTGIGTRRISGPRIAEATWTYTTIGSTMSAYTTCASDDQQSLRQVPSEQVVTNVVDPLGNVTEYYYSTWLIDEIVVDQNGNPYPDPQVSPNGFRKVEFGQPFTRMPGTASGGRFLSTRVYTPVGYAANPKQPLRSTYVTYERDNNGCEFLNNFCFHANERITSQRTVYHDDNDRAADVDYSEYDGLGNMRRVKTGGTFASGNVVTVYTAYNERDPEVNPSSGNDGFIASGTYPATFVMPTVAHAWILNTASHVKVTEGSVTAITQQCQDPATGFLRAARVLKGSSRGSSDLITTYVADGAGNVWWEHHAGGDVAANAPTSQTLCATAAAPPAADYSIQHTYDVGIPVTSQYDGASFLLRDLSVHRASGMVLSSTDSAGHTTSYEYDRAFRLRKLAPPGLAATTYTYTIPSDGTTPPAVEQVSTSQQGHGAARTQYQYDSLGQLWRQKTRLPSGLWSVTDTARNARGWLTGTSNPETLVIPAASAANPNPTEFDFVPAYFNQMSGHDPFGRPATVTTADGRTSSFEYAGISTVRKSVNIATSSTMTPVTTKETYDRQERLISVTEAEGTADAVTTSYTYDVGGRLKSVAMPGLNRDTGTTVTQRRTFQYDNRGFLEYEEHPELGISGQGRITYQNYDARGHAHQKITGLSSPQIDLTYEFDAAERVTSVKLTGTTRTLVLFDYDDPDGELYPQCTGGRCNGRLAAAARYNEIPDLGTVVATETYQYDGPGGAVTRRDHAVGSTAAFEGQNFYVAQSYTDLGQVRSITYPCRKNELHQCLSTPRTVQYGYTNGPLTSVTGYATSIAYHPNGLPATITHANGVVDTIAAEPFGVGRPSSIGASYNANGLWTSGTYQYDDAGNVTTIGAMSYLYDSFNRLRSWTQAQPNGAYSTTTIGYDNFGNQLYSVNQGCGPAGARCYAGLPANRSVVGSTNHYGDLQYDQAGNVIGDATGRTFTYDAFNRTTGSAASGREFRYVYGPDEERIALVERVPTAGGIGNRTTWTLRGFGQQLLTSWRDDATTGSRIWSWTEDEIWRGSSILGSVSPSGTKHYTLDHLGSPRLITGAAGQVLGVQTFDPLGGGGTSDGGFLQFTGQERDAAMVGGSADLPDHFHARQYDRWGRFLSVDPGKDWNQKQPQSWNRYVYVRDNPLKYADPTGKYVAVCPPLNVRCLGEAAAFEKARTQNLNSNRPAIAATSRAYGAPNTNNGVFVSFANTGNSDGSTRAAISGNAAGDGFQMTTSVTINTGMSGTRLNAVVAHEGQHVADAQAFFATVRYDRATSNLTFDSSRSLTAYQTEMNAYRMTAAVAAWKNVTIEIGAYSFSPGMKSEDIDDMVNQLLGDVQMGYGVSPANPGPTQTGW